MTLQREDETATSLRVVKASARAVRDAVDETSLETDELDLLVGPDDYKIGGTKVEPQPGDRFTETVAGVTRTYVVAPRDGDPGWRWSDEHFVDYRIHVRIDSES